MNSSPQIVPLNDNPNQSFEVPVSINGTSVSLYCNLNYNEIAGYWVLTVMDASGNIIVSSIPFITGNAPAGNILGQFAYLGIGSAFLLNAGNVPSPDFPNDQDLGTDYVLLWDTTPAA